MEDFCDFKDLFHYLFIQTKTAEYYIDRDFVKLDRLTYSA